MGSNPVTNIRDVVATQWGAVAVSEDGAILQTGSGRRWTTVASGFPGLLAIDYVIGNSVWPAHGCAVGANGTVGYSADGWTWQAGVSGTTEALRDVAFSDVETAWAVGEAGTMLRSADSGATWSPSPTGVTGTLLHLSFVDDRHGWAVGQDGVILHTADGTTWQRQTAPENVTLHGVSFVDARNGWVCGDAGQVFHTGDGGAHWTAQAASLDHDAQAIDFIDVRRGWVVDDTGVVAHTMDGGATWARQVTGMTGAASAIDFYDRSYGLVAGGSSILFTTTGGWPDTTGPVTRALRQVTATRGRLAWVWFNVSDEQCGWVHGVVIRIKRGETTVKKLTFGIDGECGANTGGRFGQGWLCKLKTGHYRYYVYAIDESGNRQSVVGSNSLVVK